MTISLTAKPDLQRVWTDDDSFATTLLTSAVDIYGLEFLDWLPATVRLELEDDLNIELPQQIFDRLMAAATLLTSNSFYKSLPDFVTTCNVLSGDAYDPTLWDPADAAEIAWGVAEAMLIAPPEEDEPFTNEIRAYIGAVLDSEGLMNPPDILRLAMRDSKHLLSQAHSEFSDDPEMFQSIWEIEKEREDDINQMLREKLVTLMLQLDALPVSDGSTKDSVKRMLANLQSDQKE